MDFKKQVTRLLQIALDENPDLFLIDLKIGLDNKIIVLLDGDKGVKLEDCIKISRQIEHNLDREEEDFSLEVSSVGVDASLEMPRQYIKNIGRSLEVKMKNGEEVSGKLIEANEEEIKLEWKAREPKPVGKGKVTVIKNKTIVYHEITVAKVIIKV